MCVRKLSAELSRVYVKFRKLLYWTVQYLREIWSSCIAFDKGSRLVQNNAIKFNFKKLNKGRNHKPIPTARGLPIVGTMFDLIRAGGARQLHKYINKRHRELGPIFRERLGGMGSAYVFVSSASLMRAVFLYEGQFPRHPLPEAWKLYNELFKCQRGLFFMENTEWLHNRRLLNRFLLNGNLSWMDTHIEASTMKLVNEWKQKAPDSDTTKENSFMVPELERRLYRWAVDVICTIMFGQNVIDYPEIDETLEAFSKIVHNVFEKSTALMDFPPKLAKLLRLRIWQEFEDNVTEVLSMGEKVIDRFIEFLKHQSTTDDFTNGQHDSLFQNLQMANVSLPLIKRIFVDLVIAAGDTTAYTATWALFLLTQNPSLQQRLADDVEKHNKHSTLINGLIKETLRLYPVAPFIGRYMDVDVIIDGYHIEKNLVSNFQLECGNTEPLEPMLRLVTVPTQALKLLIKCRDNF